MHGGAVHIDNSLMHSKESSDESEAPLIVFKSNEFLRNVAYFEGNAVYIKNGHLGNDTALDSTE